jgi:type IV pilus assembly protein PilP
MILNQIVNIKRSIPHQSLFKTLFIGVVISILSACGSGEGDDLDQFMANAGNNLGKGVEPLPEVLPYIPLQYNVDNALSDPFKARKAASKSGSLQPNLDRPKEPLESYPLESLKYVGSLSKNNLAYALIKTPDNTVQQVKKGNYIGPNFGLITEINEGEIVLKEIAQDDLTGDWVERSATLNLQE